MGLFFLSGLRGKGVLMSVVPIFFVFSVKIVTFSTLNCYSKFYERTIKINFTVCYPILRRFLFKNIGRTKGVWFLFFQVITYVLLPSSPEPDFTVFFSLGIRSRKKKNRKPKLSSSPKSGKKGNWLGKKL